MTRERAVALLSMFEVSCNSTKNVLWPLWMLSLAPILVTIVLVYSLALCVDGHGVNAVVLCCGSVVGSYLVYTASMGPMVAD